MSSDLDGLPRSEYAFPGPLRDRLVAAILAGTKTATTSLLRDYEAESEPLPTVGARAVIVDSAGEPVAVEQITGVRICRLAEVDERHARDEGEGLETVAEWRDVHERFWHSPEYLAELGDPGLTVDDDTLVVLVRFRVVQRVG